MPSRRPKIQLSKLILISLANDQQNDLFTLVHPWMKAYVAVMTHPYFAVTGPDGSFTIDNVPAGSYEVEAWHERLGTQTASVTVAGGAATADFSFKVPKK